MALGTGIMNLDMVLISQMVDTCSDVNLSFPNRLQPAEPDD